MREKMTFKKMMNIASGADSYGTPNSSIVVMNQWITEGLSEPEPIEEFATDECEISMLARDGFITVDLTFANKNVVDLSMIYDMLDYFRSLGEDPDDKMPVTSVLILPKDYEGQYYIAMLNPLIYCLTADKPTGELTTVRMVFVEDNCILYENEDFMPDLDDEDEEE